VIRHTGGHCRRERFKFQQAKVRIYFIQKLGLVSRPCTPGSKFGRIATSFREERSSLSLLWSGYLTERPLAAHLTMAYR
jgi:hypothetical protein